MAASTFAALFLAHVIADYLAQTRWLVENKRRPLALGLHIGAVLAALLLTTLSFSPWFIVLTLAHLAIDILKTFVLRGGLAAYVVDQALHLLSILAVTALAPDLWARSPLAQIEGLPLVFMIVAGLLFAARGGQYAVLTYFDGQTPASSQGMMAGWCERIALCLAMLTPWPALGLAVVIAKAASIAALWRGRPEGTRTRLLQGSAISLCWGLATAVLLLVAVSRLQHG